MDADVDVTDSLIGRIPAGSAGLVVPTFSFFFLILFFTEAGD